MFNRLRALLRALVTTLIHVLLESGLAYVVGVLV
jgi:hypothetical protein